MLDIVKQFNDFTSAFAIIIELSGSSLMVHTVVLQLQV